MLTTREIHAKLHPGAERVFNSNISTDLITSNVENQDSDKITFKITR